MKSLVKLGVILILALLLPGCPGRQPITVTVTVKNETGETLKNVSVYSPDGKDIENGKQQEWIIDSEATMPIKFEFNDKVLETEEKFGKDNPVATIHKDTKLLNGKVFSDYLNIIRIENLTEVTLEKVRWNDSNSVDIQHGETETLEGKNNSSASIIFEYNAKQRTTQSSYSGGEIVTINGNTVLIDKTKFSDHIIHAPDIRIKSLFFNKTSSELQGTISNNGNVGVVNQFHVKFWASTDDLIGLNDNIIKTLYFNEMDVGYSKPFASQVTFPVDFDNGYIIASIDPNQSIPDEITENNKYAIQYFAEASPQPIISSSSAGSAGTNEVRISVTIANNGGIVTARGVVYSTSSNPTRENSQVYDAGSGTGTFTCDLTNLSPSTKYYIRAFAVGDDGSTVYGSEFSVTTMDVVPQGTPDLIVSLSVDSTSVSPSERIKLTATIRNIGNATAVDPGVHYYRSNDSTIDPNDNPQGDDDVSNLSAGSSGTVYKYVDASIDPRNVLLRSHG